MNCAISVVIIGWDGYIFHDEIVADRYLSFRQAERWMRLRIMKRTSVVSKPFTNESVERMRKGRYEYLSFWWRTKSQLLHRQ